MANSFMEWVFSTTPYLCLLVGLKNTVMRVLLLPLRKVLYQPTNNQLYATSAGAATKPASAASKEATGLTNTTTNL
jgi:hypothetical protein